jgi:hypothetical protein
MSEENHLKTLLMKQPSYLKLRELGFTHDQILGMMLEAGQREILDAFEAAHKTTDNVGDL